MTEILGLQVADLDREEVDVGSPLSVVAVIKSLNSDGDVAYTLVTSDVHAVESIGMLRWAEHEMLTLGEDDGE